MDYFEGSAYLAQSPQLYKQMALMGGNATTSNDNDNNNDDDNSNNGLIMNQ